MKFRKKPIVIEAEQFFPDKLPWPEGIQMAWKANPDSPITLRRWDGDRPVHVIQTKENWMEVSPGDWIITGVQGERYPCKPDIFAATYEPVEDT